MITTNVRSNLGPLTTTFTPPADCTNLQFFAEGAVGQNIAGGDYCTPPPSFLGANGGDISTSVIKSCFPEGYASFYNTFPRSPVWWEHIGVYSPASICPSGYSVACAQARGKGESNPFEDRGGFADSVIWDLLRNGETASGCCPIGYVCDQVTPTICTSALSRSILVDNGVKCLGTFTQSSIPTLATYAFAMRVMVVQAATPEQTATRTATSAPTSSIPTSSAPAGSIPSDDSLSKPNHGLPLAAKVAIGVVIPLVAILTGAACFLIFRYRRKRRPLQAGQALGQDAHGNGGDDMETPKPELPGDEGMASAGLDSAVFRKAELDATIHGSGGAVELAAELAGGGLPELHGDSGLGELDSMSKGFSVIDVVGQHANGQHVDERSKGLWQWSSYYD
ncbi:hypothetical protein Trisim1_010846 [Trichoderma cf. simile WF8]